MPEDISGSLGLDTTEWKTGVAQINRDVRTIESGFKVVAAGMDDWSKSADGLKERNNALTSIIDKQKEKVSVLEAEYQRMKKSAEENGDTSTKTAAALQDFEMKVNSAKTQLAKSETELRKNTDALGDMEQGEESAKKETQAFTEETKKAEKEHKTLSETLKGVATFASGAFVAALKAAVTAITAVAGAIGTCVTKAFQFAESAGVMADDVMTLSSQVGVSAEKLQEWAYASNFIDTSVETITGSMTKMVKNMGEAAKGSDSAKGKFSALGLSIYDSTGNLKDSETLFMEAVDALAKVENATERDALAMDIFGKSAKELNPLIEAGSAAFAAMGEEARAMGVVFEEDALNAMGSFDDSMQAMKATGEGLKNTIGLSVMPMFQPFVDLATTSMASISTAMKDGLQPEEFKGIMETIFAVLQTALGDVTGIIMGILPYVTEGLNMVTTELVVFLPSLIEMLIPAAMLLLQGILDALTSNIDPILSMATMLITSVGTFLVQNIPTLVEAAKQIITGLMQYLTDNASLLMDGCISVITGLVDGITSLLPDLIPLAISMMISLALALVDAIPKLVEKLPEIIDAIINAFTQVDWISTGVSIINGILSGLLSIGESVLSAAGNIVGNIWNTITTTDWGQLGKNLLDGIVNGMGSLVDTVKEKVTGFFSNIWNGVKNFFGIHSPSTVAAEDGKNIMAGFQEGAENAQPSVLDKVKGVFSNIWNGIKSIFGFGGNNESKEAKKAGKDVTTAVADGISGGGEEAKKSVKTTAQIILDLFKTELGVQSGSSTKTKPNGENVTKGLSDGISNQKSVIETTIKDICAAILSAITNALGTGNGASTAARPHGENVTKGIASGMNGSTSQVEGESRTLASKLIDALKNALTADTTKPYGKTAAQGLIDGLKDMVSSVKSSAQTIGDEICNGISNGIKNGSDAITKAAKSAATAALNAAKKALDIHSPSRVMEKQVGLPAVQGIGLGISKNTDLLKKSMADAAGSLTQEKITPVSIPTVSGGGQPTIVSAVLKLREKEFGELVVELADSGQGFSAANFTRRELGVQLA